MSHLFDDASSGEEGKLKINEDYANKYNQWREKEEYQKLKDKYGESTALQLVADGNDDDSTSSSESEDDEGEAWGSDVEKRFFETLACLKTKDPSIYSSECKFFDKTAPEHTIIQKKKTKNDVKMTLRDYERRIVLEKGGKMSDDEEVPKTFNEEQEEIKKGFKKILQDSDLEEDDLLTIRPKNLEQQEQEEDEYKQWLKGQKEDIKNQNIKNKLKPLKDYWADPKLDENEKFLKDFFLSKRYKEAEDKNYIPTYDEIVHDSEGDLSEDEQTLERQLEFEHKYNFRFEEPDPEFIKRYPRTVEGSMRRPDTSRKQKRDEVKERKKREKEEKKEELKQLKKYKLKEIQEKLEQLKTITGNPSLPFQDDDLEEEFNPEMYDKKMNEIFNQDYYGVDEGDQKPEFPFDPEIDDENWDTYTGQEEAGTSTSSAANYHEPHCEDPDFNMDCDYEEKRQSNMNEMVEMTRRNRGRRKSLFAKKLEAKKPIFDPTQHPNYEEYLEEYYKLDYEDIIGDQPVRFKYRSVLPNDFGLDTEEILAARDKELNQWCSVKKMSQYRTEAEEMQDVHAFRSKKQNEKLKKRVLPSVYSENPEELMMEDQELARKKRRKNQGKEELEALSTEKEVSVSTTTQGKKREKIVQMDQDDQGAFESNNSTEPPSRGTDKAVTEAKIKSRKKRKHLLDPTDLEVAVKEGPVPPVVRPARAEQSKVVATQSVDCTTVPKSSTMADETSKKKTRKKKKKKNTSGINPTTSGSTNVIKKVKKQSKVKGLDITDERLKAYGLNPKKFKNSLKYGKATQA